MTDPALESVLRRTLERKMSDLGAPPRWAPRIGARARRRRAAATLATAVAVAALGVAGFVVGSLALGSSAERDPGSVADAPRRAVGAAAGSIPVASGVAGGDEWSLEAFVRSPSAPGAGDGALCLGLRYGSMEAAEFGCGIGWQEPLGSALVQPIRYTAPDGRMLVYGRVDESVAGVTVERPDGARIAGRVVEAPPELAVSFDFFVASVPDGARDLVIVATDGVGSELQRRPLSSE